VTAGAHGLPPRAVVVSRATELEELLRRHGTRAQAAFFLASRGREIEELEERHRVVRAALTDVLAAVPLRWRRALVGRDDLDRFLFEPEDVVVAVGQDGLVANVAKYLDGQIVVGVNPSRAMFDGVLARHEPKRAADLLEAATSPRAKVESRTMVEAIAGDGQRLLALNEVFIGHRSHQSARYVLAFGGARERQSSSGVVVATGTGATGWARSIAADRKEPIALPAPAARELAFFVREAFPSVATTRSITQGCIEHDGALVVASEMNEGGVAFGDGIEGDGIDLYFGQELRVRPAPGALRLLAA
jgi:NAD kinase